MNQPPPPPFAARTATDPPTRSSSAAPAVGFFLAIAGWLLAVLVVLTAGEADDPTERYFLGVVLAVIGTGIAIAATLYDVAGRIIDER